MLVRLLALVACILASSTAIGGAQVRFVASDDFNLPPKADAASVAVVQERPARAYVILGTWQGVGDSYMRESDLLGLARQKAAELGADFVLITKADTQTGRRFGPSGPSGFDLRGGGSVGSAPVMSAAFGVFAKAWLGVAFMDPGPRSTRRCVKGFNPASKAEAAGLRVGDEVLEIDGRWASDRRDMQKFLLENAPGQVVKLLVRRGDERLTFEVPLIPND